MIYLARNAANSFALRAQNANPVAPHYFLEFGGFEACLLKRLVDEGDTVDVVESGDRDVFGAAVR
jgi:hypothetical protein